jgi:hypothetical protein
MKVSMLVSLVAITASLNLTPTSLAAQTYYFPTDTTVNDEVAGNAIVGQDGMGGNTSPTFNLGVNGIVDGNLVGYNSSQLNVGGIVYENTISYNSATVNITGAINGADAYNHSTINFTGGQDSVGSRAHDESTIIVDSAVYHMSALDYSTVHYIGGSSDFVSAADHGTLILSGGGGSHISASGESTVLVNGGGAESIDASNDAHVTFLSGVLNGGAFGNCGDEGDNSIFTMSGGVADGKITLSQNSTFNLEGGDVDYMSITNNSIVNLSGGFVQQGLFATDNSLVKVYGSGLSANNIGGSAFLLSGRLLNGMSADGIDVYLQSNAHLELINVPEPGVGALTLGLGLVGVFRLRKRRLYREE